VKGPRWSLTPAYSSEPALRSSATREPFAEGQLPLLVPDLCSCVRRIASRSFLRPAEEQVQEKSVPSFDVFFCSFFQPEFEIHPKL